MNNDKKGSDWLIVILLLIVVVAIFFFPKINEFIVKIRSPKIENITDESKKENKVFNKEIIEDVHFPIMRSGIYSDSTYYSLDKFTISDMKNSDILLNSFLDMYEGNIISKGSASCGGQGAEFDQKYLELRIKNILGRNTNYKFENFEVPNGNDSKYIGSWTYNSSSKKFVYKGKCNQNTGKTKYYDLKQLKEGKYEGNDLVLYYYVGFAKVEGNSYTIYSKPDMKDQIYSGSFLDLNTLQSTFESINNKNKKIYKFVFKNSICTYSEYCLYEGSWN